MAVKESILQKSLTAHYLDENELIELLKTTPTDLGDAADLPRADAGNVGQAYLIKGIHYRSEEVSAGVYDWVTYDTSGQSLHYPDATGKPKINGIPLIGDQLPEAYGVAKSDTERTILTNITGTEYIPLDIDDKIDVDTLGAYVVSNFVDTYIEAQLDGAENIEIKYSNQKRISIIDNSSFTTVNINLVTTNENGAINILNIPQRVIFHNTAGSVTLNINIGSTAKYSETIETNSDVFFEYTLLNLTESNAKIVIINLQYPAFF